MKQWRVYQHGGPEALRLEECLDPALSGAGNIRIRVLYVGLNHLDLWVRRGVEGHRFPLPLVPGCDTVGEIESLSVPGLQSALGEPLQVGDRVLIDPLSGCGHCEACLRGAVATCHRFGLMGETVDGGCCEWKVVLASSVYKVPDGKPLTEVATLPIAGITAWSMLFRRAQIEIGDWVLVRGASSGVSIFCIQLAKAAGAHVLATVSSSEKFNHAKALGADQVFVSSDPKWREQLRTYCQSFGKKGVDVVVDHVGVATLNESLKCLRWGGTLVTCGATTGSEVTIDLKLVFFKSLSILGSTMGHRGDLGKVLEAYRSGKIRPIVDTVFPFTQLPEAHAHLEGRNAFGKVVLQVGE